jgi:molecular chaperone DnaK (HSP70)
MTQGRFSIGIDLGTTNCALAFVPLQGDGPSEVLAVPQWTTLSAIAESTSLPSFLYLPEEAAASQLPVAKTVNEEWIVGQLARKRAAESPGRIAHSAKSWLCHHTADRSAGFLPWGSDDIARDSKISPVRASALILSHLKRAWNRRFADAGADCEFNRQEITVTVPASFDAAAQRLTVMAALEAGFPETVCLLEEPQAAFYCWLEQHDFVTELVARLPNRADGTHHVLVVDIGGGTSDFSLFELCPQTDGSAPHIKRKAVGDHILLGGDNVDLAIAHLLEPRLTGERHGKLLATEWDDLIARCRDLKEKLLTDDGPPDEPYPIALPGRGSGLVAAMRTAQLTRAEIEGVLLDGFFPDCPAHASPYRAQAALKEWGLPYASDGAVTRHLAAFLRGRPRVDAILFNGGALRPEFLRARICQQVNKWQGGPPPLALENAAPELAVARGAALFGQIRHCGTGRIEATAARAVFLEVGRGKTPEADEPARPSLVCVLPHGAASEQRFEITGLPLEVQTNRLARFQAYYSTRGDRSRAGDIITLSEEDHHALPPLETVVKLTDVAPDTSATLPVSLIASANELGLLQISFVSTDPSIKQSWPLEFNLRPHEQDGPAAAKIPAAPDAAVPATPNVSGHALEAARVRIKSSLNSPPNRRETLTATRLLKSLEQIVGMPKSEWNAGLVRALWPALENSMARRKESPDHEEAWLILAGFLLRPGYGAAADAVRIDNLWRLREHGLAFPGKRSKVQEYVLWRRVAGGLVQQRQEQILAPELDKIRMQKKVEPELIRLAGSLERLPIPIKTELANLFIDAAASLAGDNKHCAPYLGALGHLLNRAPLYAGPETVVAPDLVERAYDALRSLNWAAPELAEMQTLFLRAARVVDSRNFDLPRAARYRIATQLENAGVSAQKTAKLKEFTPLGGAERMSLHDEALPPGLILTGAADYIC